KKGSPSVEAQCCGRSGSFNSPTAILLLPPHLVVIGQVTRQSAAPSTSTHVAYSPCCYGRCGTFVRDGLTACKNAESVFDQTLFATCLIGVSQRQRYRWRATGRWVAGPRKPVAMRTLYAPARRRHLVWRRRAI